MKKTTQTKGGLSCLSCPCKAAILNVSKVCVEYQWPSPPRPSGGCMEMEFVESSVPRWTQEASVFI